VGAAGAAKVLVAVPTDFTLSESCQELMDALCGVRARPPAHLSSSSSKAVPVHIDQAWAAPQTHS